MIPPNIIFLSYLIILILSIVCSLFVLYHLFFDRILRHALHNYVIRFILLLGFISEVTNYPWMLYYYQHEGQWKRSLLFCETWAFLDWRFYITHTMLFAWATIERHILIFHEKYLSTKTKRFFIHYLPPLVILVYGLVFYFIITFSPPCQNIVNHYSMLCVISCLNQTKLYTMWEAIVHQMLSVFTILIFSSALLLRVLHRKHRLHQRVQWRKYRKMTIQVLSIASLYIIFYIPATLAYTMAQFKLTSKLSIHIGHYTTSISYFMIPLFPFVCVLSLPELRTNLIQIFSFQRSTRRVQPTTFYITALVKRDIIIQ